MPKPPHIRISPRVIARVVQIVMEANAPVTIEDVRGDSRTYRISEARRVLCWVLREIGCIVEEVREVIPRDRSTILHHAKRARQLISYDASYRRWATGILDNVQREINPINL